MDRSCHGAGASTPRFPRRRGDGPSRPERFYGTAKFSPQARGWTRGPRGQRSSFGVFPAGAGMDPRVRLKTTWPHCFPRRRGDGPPYCIRMCHHRAFSPQARGWTLAPAPRGRRCPVFPAGAGMDPGSIPVRSCLPGFPRRRGDGPSPSARSSSGSGFSPQARGWTPKSWARGAEPNVFPAGAGMDPPPPSLPPSLWRFPRRRGDGPPTGAYALPITAFSPQARGWTCARSRRGVSWTVFPAGAGMDPVHLCSGIGSLRFPRRRGDGPCWRPAATCPPTFSPQARGWTRLDGGQRATGRVFPAGAGMDRDEGRGQDRRPGFPRRRGDGPHKLLRAAELYLFSPQARGWTVAEALGGDAHEVFPAGAGMDLSHPPRKTSAPVFPAGAGMDPRHLRSPVDRRCFPRRRGDGPRFRGGSTSTEEFSPQARGWTPSFMSSPLKQFVFPAGAGMDPRCLRPRSCCPGFPRRRGDGPQQLPGLVDFLKFSPQARGWTPPPPPPTPPCFVFPAGAGMDPA